MSSCHCNPAFRPVRSPDDIAAVSRLANEIWREYYDNIVSRAQTDYMLDKFQSPAAIAQAIADGCEYFLIANSSQNAGYLAVIANREDRTLFLSKIYLHKSVRGTGLGRQALRFIENVCRERGLNLIWLTVNKGNFHSIDWYLRRGFRNAGPVVKDIGGGFLMDDFRMEKQIT